MSQITKVLLAVMLLMYCSLSSAIGNAEYAKSYDPARDPFKDLAMAMSEAKKNNKYILIVAGGEWCTWCHVLEAYLKKEKKINQELLDIFEVMKLNFSKENKNKKFFSTLPDAPAYPHFFILDNSGKVLLSKNTTPLEKGNTYSNNKFRILINHFKKKRLESSN
ncbi:thioredoxin family protein [Aliikangiella sp. IMCC44359]|uniref:thioredoxin family protein n=1 Tax=Aliikangiella sp. IMCC44359 TaxID=3459125 RepID=UPI00403AF49E